MEATDKKVRFWFFMGQKKNQI